MKKLILVMSVVLMATMAMASGWDNYWGLSGNPITAGYYSTLYSNSILPITANTGTIGSSTNAFNRIHSDSLYLTDSLFANKTAGGKRVAYVDTIHFIDRGVTAYPLFINASQALECALSFKTTASATATQGFYTTGGDFNNTKVGGKTISDTGRFMTVKTAKDTCLEVALFTRTCTRDTLAFMTGADSLTAAYIVTPFATRGAISIPPYIAGVVGGKLVVDRPEADTADYDRYSVTKIMQR